MRHREQLPDPMLKERRGSPENKDGDSQQNGGRSSQATASNAIPPFAGNGAPESPRKGKSLVAQFFEETGEDGLLINNLWYLRSQDDGTMVFQKKQINPNSTAIQMREYRVLPVPVNDVMAMLQNHRRWRKWDPAILAAKELEKQAKRRLMYVVVKGMAGSRPRDMFFYEHVEKIDDQTWGVLLSPADEKAGDFIVEDCVRGELMLSGYVCRIHPENSHQTIVIFLNQHDFKHMSGWMDNFHRYRSRLVGLERTLVGAVHGAPLSSDSHIWMNDGQRHDMMRLARRLTERSKDDISAAFRESDPCDTTEDEDQGPAEYPMEQVLNDGICRMYFGRYLDMEFCRENLSFWEAVDVLKQMAYAFQDPANHSEYVVADLKLRLALQAEALYKEYVGGRTGSTVNLSGELREAIRVRMEAMRQGEPVNPQEIFDDAIDLVVMLLRQGPYQRFLKSTLYADMLQWLDQNGFHVQERMLAAFMHEIRDTGYLGEGNNVWVRKESSSDGQFVLFRKKVKGLHCTQEWGMLSATPGAVTEVVSRYDSSRHAWDPRCQSAQVLCDIGDTAKVLRVVYEAPLLKKTRESCVLWTTLIDSFERQYVLLQSVNCKDWIPKGDHGRVDVHISGFRADPLPDGKTCMVTYLRQLEDRMVAPANLGKEQFTLAALQGQFASCKQRKSFRMTRARSSGDMAQPAGHNSELPMSGITPRDEEEMTVLTLRSNHFFNIRIRRSVSDFARSKLRNRGASASMPRDSTSTSRGGHLNIPGQEDVSSPQTPRPQLHRVQSSPHLSFDELNRDAEGSQGEPSEASRTHSANTISRFAKKLSSAFRMSKDKDKEPNP
eukprot:comp23366_c2_seq1/m.38616 comp23366_c2_seq1/g.38616  ORF comp23366_c2_seq1/g.38616 comp23366_c2_seq1/m.38616 type:complete len:834 (-) comp23366_c2_seq1:208-2709(-)